MSLFLWMNSCTNVSPCAFLYCAFVDLFAIVIKRAYQWICFPSTEQNNFSWKTLLGNCLRCWYKYSQDTHCIAKKYKCCLSAVWWMCDVARALKQTVACHGSKTPSDNQLTCEGSTGKWIQCLRRGSSERALSLCQLKSGANMFHFSFPSSASSLGLLSPLALMCCKQAKKGPAVWSYCWCQ